MGGCGHLIKRTAPVSNKLRPPGTQQLRDPCGPATPGLYRSVTGLRNSVTVGPATPTGHITDDTVPQRRCDSQTPRDPERHCSPMTGHTPSYGPPADWRMGRGRGAPLHVRANPPATHGPTRVGGRVCRMRTLGWQGCAEGENGGTVGTCVTRGPRVRGGTCRPRPKQVQAPLYDSTEKGQSLS